MTLGQRRSPFPPDVERALWLLEHGISAAGSLLSAYDRGLFDAVRFIRDRARVWPRRPWTLGDSSCRY